jgi:hypothetical protein
MILPDTPRESKVDLTAEVPTVEEGTVAQEDDKQVEVSVPAEVKQQDVQSIC